MQPLLEWMLNYPDAVLFLLGSVCILAWGMVFDLKNNLVIELGMACVVNGLLITLTIVPTTAYGFMALGVSGFVLGARLYRRWLSPRVCSTRKEL